MRSKPDPVDQPERTAHYDCAMQQKLNREDTEMQLKQLLRLCSRMQMVKSTASTTGMTTNAVTATQMMTVSGNCCRALGLTLRMTGMLV